MGIIKSILYVLGIGILIYGLWFILNQDFLGALAAIVLGIVFAIIIVKKVWEL